MQYPAGIPPSHTQKLKMGSIQTCVRNKCANVNEKPALMLYYLSLIKLGRKTKMSKYIHAHNCEMDDN